MKSNQELAEEKYPEPENKYRDFGQYINACAVKSAERAAFLAGIEVDRWMPISSAAFNLMSQKEVELVVILFDTGEICRYYEDWPFAIATHYFSIPLPPKSITTDK